jgi:hypothetical protein
VNKRRLSWLKRMTSFAPSRLHHVGNLELVHYIPANFVEYRALGYRALFLLEEIEYNMHRPDVIDTVAFDLPFLFL